VVAILEYFHHALHGAGILVSPAFYYPAQGTLGYSDAYLAHAIPYNWLRDWGWDIFSCYQAVVLFFNLLNYVFCFLMIRYGFGWGVPVSSFGAFVFAFNAPKFNQMGHTQLQFLCLLPLAVWALITWAKKNRELSQGRAFFLLSIASICLVLQLLTAFYPAWYFLFWSSLFLVLALAYKPTRLFLLELLSRFRPALLGAGIVFAAGLIPFLLLYLPVLMNLGGKDYSEVLMTIPNPWSFLWMGPRHEWWGWLWDKCAAIRSFPIEGEERMGFGLAILVLWLALTVTAAWFLVKRNQRRENSLFAGFMALLVLATSLFCLIGLEYGGKFSPWRWVYEFVPGGGSIRAVSRYGVFLALPISIALSYVCHRLLERAKGARKWGLKAALMGVTFLVAGTIVMEQVKLPPFPAFYKTMELNRLEYLSEKLPASCRLFYATVKPGIPWSATDIQIDAMLISAVRGIPTFNGYSGHSPHDWWLYRVRSPKYGEYVGNWIKLHQIQEPVCRLDIDR
jgi:hypothetical protein